MKHAASQDYINNTDSFDQVVDRNSEPLRTPLWRLFMVAKNNKTSPSQVKNLPQEFKDRMAAKRKIEDRQINALPKEVWEE